MDMHDKGNLEKKILLHEVIPVDTPLGITIEPSAVCNLKCYFCKTHSLLKSDAKKTGIMSRKTMDLLIEQLKKFPKPIKLLTMCGSGEPLVNKELPSMVEQLIQSGSVGGVRVITNGVLLNKKISEDLINAGVSHIKVSINGLSEADYLENCGVKIDFEKFLSELKYLYENKSGAKIRIKIIDDILKGRSEDEFYEMFGKYCDKIVVEKLIKTSREISIQNQQGNIEEITTCYNEVTAIPDICAAPFYRATIKWDGGIFYCCGTGLMLVDDINGLYEGWNGEAHKELMCKVLKKEHTGIAEKCRDCHSRNNFGFDENLLDNHADEIYERICKL